MVESNRLFVSASRIKWAKDHIAVDPRSSLIALYLSLGCGALVAFSNPASEYELSIYSGTSDIFWFLMGVSLCFSIYGSLWFRNSAYSGLSLVGGVISLVTIASLPLIRGYYYISEGDSLNHLGITRELNSGIIEFAEIRYPVVSFWGSTLGDILAYDVRYTLLLVIVIFVGVFFIFVPLTVVEIWPTTTSLVFGVYSGLLLLPINHLGVHMHVHPTSQAIMYLPAVLYAIVRYLNSSDRRWIFLYLLITSMYVLLHPQQAANVVFLLIGISFSIPLLRRLFDGDSDTNSSTGVSLLVISLGTFWIWVSGLAVFENGLRIAIVSILQETTAAASAASRSGSLLSIGGSIFEIFWKLFLIPSMYIALSSIFILWVLLKKLRPVGEFVRPIPDLALYLSFGLLPVFIVFIIYLGGGISDQYFRHFGFLMGVVTILGAVALSWVFDRSSVLRRRSGNTYKLSIIIVLLLLCIPVIFSSPYVYYDSDHITKSYMVGHETTFDYGSEEYSYAYVRAETGRYGMAINGPSEKERNAYYPEGEVKGGAPDNFASQNLPGYYNQSRYLVVTNADEERETILYKGFRFTRDDFRYLETSEKINRIQTTGGLRVYEIRNVS